MWHRNASLMGAMLPDELEGQHQVIDSILVFSNNSSVVTSFLETFFGLAFKAMLWHRI